MLDSEVTKKEIQDSMESEPEIAKRLNLNVKTILK
jgi:hypothetical protein